MLARGMMLFGLMIFAGCGAIPIPANASFSVSDSREINGAANSSLSLSKTVLWCIADNLEKKAGLKIVGMIIGFDEPAQVFALPKNGDGLFVIGIKELNIEAQTSKMRLTLVLRVFDGSGSNVYKRSITRVGNAASKNQSEVLRLVTKDILKQYARDSLLRDYAGRSKRK